MTAFNKAWIILKQLGQDDLSGSLPPYNPISRNQHAGHQQPPWSGDPNTNAPPHPSPPLCKLCRKNPLISYNEQVNGICTPCRILQRQQREIQQKNPNAWKQNPDWHVYQQPNQTKSQNPNE